MDLSEQSWKDRFPYPYSKVEQYRPAPFQRKTPLTHSHLIRSLLTSSNITAYTFLHIYYTRRPVYWKGPRGSTPQLLRIPLTQGLQATAVSSATTYTRQPKSYLSSTLPIWLPNEFKLSAVFLKVSCPSGWFRLLKNCPHSAVHVVTCCSGLSHCHLIAPFKNTLKLTRRSFLHKNLQSKNTAPVNWICHRTEIFPTTLQYFFPKMALPPSLFPILLLSKCLASQK